MVHMEAVQAAQHVKYDLTFECARRLTAVHHPREAVCGARTANVALALDIVTDREALEARTLRGLTWWEKC